MVLKMPFVISLCGLNLCKAVWATCASQGTGLLEGTSRDVCVPPLRGPDVVASKEKCSSRTSIETPPAPRLSTLGRIRGNELGLQRNRSLPSLTLAARLLTFEPSVL